MIILYFISQEKEKEKDNVHVIILLLLNHFIIHFFPYLELYYFIFNQIRNNSYFLTITFIFLRSFFPLCLLFP